MTARGGISMKRYRVLTMDFDSRATILNVEVAADWDPTVKSQWLGHKNRIVEQLMTEYGTAQGHRKIEDFKQMGASPFSVVAFHNKFLQQIRDAFAVGAYYPALTGACALGERILNHLILALRDFYKSSPEYKKVYDKRSFDNWDLAISTLEAWGVFRPEVSDTYRELRDARNAGIHFRPETDENERNLALNAVGLLTTIIQRQFGAIGSLPWLIPGTQGTSFIKKEWESNPFIRAVYLPNCVVVGPYHRLEHDRLGGWRVFDDYPYEEREVSDEEFTELANGGRPVGDS